jgi:hypothetical protein
VFLGFGLSVPFYHVETIDDRQLSTAIAALAGVLGQVLVAGYGVWRCYHANGGPSGPCFAETFISIAWVVSVRLLLFALIPYIALLAALREFSSHLAELLVLGLYIIYFWRIWVHIGWVHDHRRAD